MGQDQRQVTVSQERRSQAVRRDESERGLVKAAIAVISEDGVGAATFEAIAGRGGYSRGLVGQRFGSKRGLIEAVINYLQEKQDARALVIGIDKLPGLEALVTHVDLYLQQLSLENEGQAYFRLLSSAVADGSELQAAFAATHGRVRERLEGWVRRGQAEGDIRPEVDPSAAALMIGSLLLGVSMQVLVDPSMALDPIRATSVATLRLAFATPTAARP
jgi:AcrR family transcriptional regulator